MAKYVIDGDDRTGAAFRSMLGNAQGAANKMTGLFKTAFAGISVAAVGAFGVKMFAAGEELQVAAKKARLGAQEFTSLAYVTKMYNIDVAELSKGLSKMQVFLSKAADGSKENVQTLRDLGIEIDAIRDLKADKQFELIAEQISRLGEEEDQTRIGTEIFSKSFQSIAPVFEKGAEGIRAAREEAERMGKVMTDEQLAKLAAADDAVDELAASWEHFGMVLGAKVAPPLTSILDGLTGRDLEKGTIEERIKKLRVMQSMATASPEEKEEFQRRIDALRMERISKSGRRGGGASSDAMKSPLGLKEGMEQRRADAEAEAARKAAKKAADAAAKEDEERAQAYADTMDEMNQTIWAQHEEMREQELEATLEQIAIVEEARKTSEDALAEYRAERDAERFEREQEFLDNLSADLTDVFLRGGDGFEDMLKRWAADWMQSEIRNMLGTFFGQGGPQEGGGGTGQSLFGWLGSMMGNGGGGGGSNFVQGEWDWMKGGGGFFGSLGKILGFANGGRPPVGRPSIVGERGPELFIPDSAGTVLPKLGGAAPQFNIAMHMDNRGASVDFIKALPAILDKNNKMMKLEFAEELRRHLHGIG